MKNEDKYEPNKIESKWPSDAKALAGKQSYKPDAIEKHWQKVWAEKETYSPDIESAKKPFYNLMMFPYPSAEGLHVGNMYAFTGADVYGRFKRMQGNDVFEPIGLDGFGIHSENYALKVGKHPKEQAKVSQENFYRQLHAIGNGFDFTRTLETYDPEYYKWTQWLFITLFKSGLAYRKKAEVNWCPSDNTVLADEQVIDGRCERDGAVVEKKFLEQWFFRITDYAQRLLDNIESLDWSDKVKIAQRNWIGRSEGAEVEFEIAQGPAAPHPHPSSSSSLRVDDGGPPVASPLAFKIKVFTTRPDTLYGATFMVVSPEHEIVASLLSSKLTSLAGRESRREVQSSNLGEVRDYVEKAKAKTDIERTAEGKDKTGVFTGLYAINPVNNKKIPVWIADYVLSSYGTGAIMAVPAHDERDFEFAKKYGLEIRQVVSSKKQVSSMKKNRDTSYELPATEYGQAYEGSGFLINSDSWNEFHVPKDIGKVIDDLEKRGLAKRKVNYHLRDWLISRQRYWGPPIPMIYCEVCFKQNRGEREEMPGWYSEKEENLPVLLPDVKDWKPMGTGKAPLANHPEFYEVKCPECGSDSKRETDVSDTFLDSAWYFLRYPSIKALNSKHETLNKSQVQNLNDKNGLEIRNSDLELPWNPEVARRWLPVNMYIGGAEHSVLHLLYSRFITMVLKDLGHLDFEEPFSKFYAHGLIIKDGAKMSKSKGNVVVPDEYIAKYGADALRTYLMFIGPYSDGGDFRDSGIEGIYRFLKRVWRLMESVLSIKNEVSSKNYERDTDYVLHVTELNAQMHRTIKGVTEDLENLRYNTAIAKLMEFYNALNSFYTKYQILDTKYVQNFLLLLAPFAPHMAEELWQELGYSVKGEGFSSIHKEKWPEFDPKMIEESEVTIVVQVNGKRRAELKVESGKLKDESLMKKEAENAVAKYLEGKEIRKTIYVKGKIVNFVV
jgi:leucyl-tRNA synthetase